MLKVLINEEEVLTNKDFTIKKEMLNTPSVILNNVYPKTWEDEKDYTSNFYHPQDYSKCKIIDEYIVPAEPGETITGTSFTIQDNDNTKLNELTEIDGNTTQSGTPTPSSPQPINVVSGRQEVSVAGKNLLDISTLQDGYVSSSGAIATAGLTNEEMYSNFIKVEPNTKYTFKIFESSWSGIENNNWLGIGEYSSNNISSFIRRDVLGGTNTSITITTSQNTQYIIVSARGLKSATKIQLEKGQTPSTYEEYKGQSYEINLGNNLFDKSVSPSSQNGTTTTELDTGIRATTTATGQNKYTAINLPNPNNLLGKTLTISATITPSGTNNALIRFYWLNGNNLTNLIANTISTTGSQTITIPSSFPTNNNGIAIVFSSNSNSGTSAIGDYVDYTDIQLEVGSQATSYSPYKTPIELCKIGDYQDKIYKENGTWYLHKEIGKVVLTGADSENITRNPNGTNSYFVPITNLKYGIDNIVLSISNYFKGITFNNRVTGGDNTCYAENGISSITIRNTTFTSLANFKTWLSTHNTIIYYVLATPTTTEITDTELISQLNGIELLEGLNNVSVSSVYLPSPITIHYNYTEEQTIDDLLFCGVVKNSGNISLNPREPHFQSLQILDFKTFLSEGELDSFVIYQKTILEAIQMVIANIQDYGFILGNVNILNPNDIIGAYSTKDKTAYDVFNYIADITQSRWTTRLIDENHVAIDFYDPTLMTEGTPINYTQTFFENNLIDDMTYSYGSNNYRNKQVMTSSQVYSNISQQQSIVANGYQTQFPTEQPIGKINSITSNGIPLTFATFNEKEMGYVADFYYSPGDNYFESEDLRTTGEILIIDYVAIVEGRQIITNPLEIDRINDSTGRKGIISRYEQRNDATTSTELQKIGESYIKYKGTPEIKLKISTRSNIWEVGQRVQFNAPIEELDTEYMVRTKKINYISTIDTIFYEYELISSFNSETEINYFDNQRAKASGNIGEGEYISRNIDIESTANIIFYDTETTEVQVDGDNELNSILNSPFIS